MKSNGSYFRTEECRNKSRQSRLKLKEKNGFINSIETRKKEEYYEKSNYKQERI